MKLIIGFFKFLNFGLAAATLLAYLAPFVDPRDFWPLIFFGLAYPFFLVGNLLFIIFWLVVKKRMIWISFLVILLGFSNISKIVGFNFQKSEDKETIKILSFNVGGFYQFRKDEKLLKKGMTRFYSFLEEEQFGIASFQEFSPTIAEKLNEERSPYFRNIALPQKELLIGSNFKIDKNEKLKFNEIKGNGIVWADIKWKGKTIRVYNFHLKSTKISYLTNQFNFRSDFFSKKGIQYLKTAIPRYKQSAITRLEMIEKLRVELKKCPYPIILCGDMNESPISYAYQKISKGLKDTFVEKGSGWGKTYNGKIPGLRIDYIFVSPEIEVVDFKIVKNDFSDHFPVICNLKLNGG